MSEGTTQPQIVMVPSGPQPDPAYEWVPPLGTTPCGGKRGRQCGQCGVKFDYNTSYGFYCGSNCCPMGFK